MARKTTKAKTARKRTQTARPKARPKNRKSASRYTSKDTWKQQAAKRWPTVDRPLSRLNETEGTVGLDAQDQQEFAKQAASSRLAALAQVAASMAPASPGAPPMPPLPGSSNWTQLGPLAIPNGQTYSAARVLVSGRVTAIAIDPTAPDTVYLGTAQGGVWKSTNNGTTWAPKTDHEVSLAVGALALDPNSPQIVYVGTGEGNFSLDSYYGLGILKSTDGGATWTNLASTLFRGNRFRRLIVDPTSGTPATRLFAATLYGLYRSTDGGTSWTKLSSGLPANAMATDAALDAASSTLYVAFWNAGVYKSTNANAGTPTFTKLTAGLPVATAPSPNGVTRIALALAPSNPQTVFALMSNNDMSKNASYTIDKFYVSTNGGASWTAIALPSGNIGRQGFYNLAVSVDPTTPDIVYLSATSLWKAVKSGSTWAITDIGTRIHPDNHVLGFRPGNHLTVWAGNDGGVYRSADGGTTWDDSVNKGLCITQLEFIDQHPSSPAVVFGGTQDNGTEQYRGTSVFTHADDGDGGFVTVNQGDPRHVVSTYYLPSPKRSVQGGKFGTWVSVATGLGGTGSLFYPPMTSCRTNPNALAFGTTLVNIDPAEGTGEWKTQVALPGLGADERVSALSYVNANLIYAGTELGKVYKLAFTTGWTATMISQSPLPTGYIWDVSPLPGNDSIVIVVMGSFGIGHVWRGMVPGTGSASWNNVSGNLPDIPVNALVIDPVNAQRMFIGTDIGVFETLNGGDTWSNISASSAGFPNCAVFDLRLHEATRILRAATHGRGLWEKPVDAPSTPATDIYVRGHAMDTARMFPRSDGVAAAFDDPLRQIALSDPQYIWMCADIKIDALEGSVPSYQMQVADVDFVAFESKLAHRHPQRSKVNRIYVQVHNRGFQPALNVNAKLLWVDANAGAPALPSDFWTAFPGDSTNKTQWRPIGTAKVIASLEANSSKVLEWDWTPPASAHEHACMIVVIDSASDPIPAGNKVFDLAALAFKEKHVGWKNLHLVGPSAGPSSSSSFAMLNFNSSGDNEQLVEVVSHGQGTPAVTLIFSKNAFRAKAKLAGLVALAPGKALLKALTNKYGAKEMATFDTGTAFTLKASTRQGSLAAILRSKTIRAVIAAGAGATGGGATFSIIQSAGGRVVGGSTFVVKRQ